jgi:uncharacterized membrane protein
MPFCSHCGGQVSDQDLYCRGCGTRQPVTAAPPGEGLNPRTASLLCYVPFLGWIAAVVALASNRFRQNRSVRFHAFQGLYLFVAWLIVHWVLSPIPAFRWARGFHFHDMLELAVLGVSIFMMIKVGQGQDFSLPILGELAQKSVAET